MLCTPARSILGFLWGAAMKLGEGYQRQQEISDKEQEEWLAVRMSGKGIGQEVEEEAIRNKNGQLSY